MSDDSESERLYEDAKLVVYTSELDDLDTYSQEERDELREWQEKTGLNSVSLWARWESEEIPIYSLAPSGSWFSLSVEIHQNVSDNHVSEAFVTVCSDVWDIDESVWEAMSDAEKLVANRLRHNILMGNPIPEQIEIIKWCEAQRE